MAKVIKPMMKTANKMSTERKAKETPTANASILVAHQGLVSVLN